MESLRVAALAVAIALLGFVGSAVAQTPLAKISGKARIVDGDTINIGGIQIRLEGIDAPETEQTCFGAKGDRWQCGKTATQRLAGLIKGEEVTCEKSGEDRYRRTLAFCRLADGTELNAWLVREGLALAFVRYSTRYVKEEKEAKDARRGLWAGTFQAPWEWRASNGAQEYAAPIGLMQRATPVTTQAKSNAGCLIKGNINRRGDRIYHVPGSKWYSRTEINEGNGERWFCSVAEAEAAGWRAPRGRN
ncbi:MAG: thermonuclease family protein [Nitrospira sp.]|nr:thermonuclease family protein [Nitrospira sp.]MBX3513119.1 thermonuclease family protein [Xanthobacteraceae bacterium]